jgi:catechol 2,3-dioxygenase
MAATTSIIGPVTLITREPRRLAEFYQKSFGIGEDRTDLLTLENQPDAIELGRTRTTGLFHMAILLPSRKDLAGLLKHFIDTRVPIHGASDHGVSEAIYLADPDGNGIEVYCDRPRDKWVYKHGQIQMGTLPLDLEDLLAEADHEKAPWTGIAAGTIMGHVHLRVADLAPAEAFYRDVIGMQITTRYGSEATFLSFHGYHHHLGLNTWQSKGAPPPPVGATGLKNFVLNLPGDRALDRVKSIAGSKDIPFETLAEGIFLRDPSGNGVIVRG